MTKQKRVISLAHYGIGPVTRRPSWRPRVRGSEQTMRARDCTRTKNWQAGHSTPGQRVEWWKASFAARCREHRAAAHIGCYAACGTARGCRLPRSADPDTPRTRKGPRKKSPAQKGVKEMRPINKGRGGRTAPPSSAAACSRPGPHRRTRLPAGRLASALRSRRGSRAAGTLEAPRVSSLSGSSS